MKMIPIAMLALALCIGPRAGFAQTSLIDGEVVRVDQPAAKITLKHGPIKKLGMDVGMTMVFQAREPEILTTVKAGDHVKFDAEKINGQYVVTKLEKR